MVQAKGSFVTRVLPGIGLAVVWAFLAYIVETFAVGLLKVAGSQGGILAPAGGWDLWIRPTTVLGAALFLIVAVAFVRLCVRSGVPVWLTATSMAMGVSGFWTWAVLYGRDLAITHPEMGLAAWIRFAAPVSVSSTAGICAGVLVAILLTRRIPAATATDA